MTKNNNIIAAIREARKTKGLSQSELSSRIGVPQSHISKIENGAVDLRLSSLIQIARALDLELKLVPRKSLPAVESIVRSTRVFWNSLAHQTAITDKIPRPAYSFEDDDDG